MFTFHSNAQWYSKYYGNKDLNDLTAHERIKLYQYANDTRILGNSLIKGGLIGSGMGLVIFFFSFDSGELSNRPNIGMLQGGVFLFGGCITFLTGMVVRRIGVYRMNNIKNAMATYHNDDVSLKISPTFRTNPYSSGYNTGITIQLTF